MKFNEKELNEHVRIWLINTKSHFNSTKIKFASLNSMVFDNHLLLKQISSYLKQALSSENLANLNSFSSEVKQREIHLTQLQFLHIEFSTEISHIRNELLYLENLLNVFTYASLTIVELSHHINKLNVYKNTLDQWFNANDIKLKITEYTMHENITIEDIGLLIEEPAKNLTDRWTTLNTSYQNDLSKFKQQITLQIIHETYEDIDNRFHIL